jgi:hypothetical protein
MTYITPIRDRDRQMPMPMPLVQPAQPLRRTFHDADAPAWTASPRTGWWRLAVFVPAVLTTVAIAAATRLRVPTSRMRALRTLASAILVGSSAGGSAES